MKIILDEGAKMPTRAHPWDAGLDLYAREGKYIPAECGVEFDTGVHLDIPKGFVGLVKSRSGLMMKNSIITDGTIDAGYRMYLEGKTDRQIADALGMGSVRKISEYRKRHWEKKL